MATRKRQGNKNGLEEAVQNLTQAQAQLTVAQATLSVAQATLAQNQASFLARISEIDRINSERFARIEEELTIIKTMLIRHEEILQNLPEAIREKIGFKSTQ